MANSPQGNGAPEAPQGEASGPNYVTEERLNEAINRAITSRFSSFEKKIGGQVSEAVTGLLPKLDEIVQARLPQPSQGSAGASEKPLEESPLVKGLQKKLAELEEQNRKSQSERDAERARARDVALRQRLSEELGKHGVDARYVKQALGFLVDAEKRVRWADDEGDALVFRDSDGSELDLSTGLRSWAKSDDAKIYMPPRGLSGSGDRGGGQAPRTQPQGASREQLGRALLAGLGTGVRLTE